MDGNACKKKKKKKKQPKSPEGEGNSKDSSVEIYPLAIIVNLKCYNEHKSSHW